MNTDLSDPNLTDFERAVIHILFFGSHGPSVDYYYLQPDGVSYYLRPDGSSLYIRP